MLESPVSSVQNQILWVLSKQRIYALQSMIFWTPVAGPPAQEKGTAAMEQLRISSQVEETSESQ